MTIQPIQPNPTPSQGARPLDPSATPAPVQPDGRPATGARRVPGDQVEISQTAREIDRRQPSGPEGSQLPADTLRVLVERVCSGFYDQPEVRDVVLDRLANDLGSLSES